MSKFSILIDDASGTNRANLVESAVGLRIGTVLPGGMGDASFRIYDSTRFIPNYLGSFFTMRILDGNRTIWRGRLEEFKAHRGMDGEYWIITGRGSGIYLDDQAYGSTTKPALDVGGKITSDIVTNVVSSGTNAVNLLYSETRGAVVITLNLSITATGRTLNSVSSVLNRMTAAAVINWAADFGDNSNNQQIWYVYPDDTASGTATLTFKPRPTTPDVEAYVKDFELNESGLRGSALANRVVLEYNNGASVYEANDTVLQGTGPTGWGITRETRLSIPEITNATDAQYAANTLLGIVKVARLSSNAIRLTRNAVLYDSNNSLIEPWRVRSGMLMKLRDVDQSLDQINNLSFINSFLIVGTEWDEDAQTLSITPENYDNRLELVVARTRALLSGVHTVV